MTDRLDVSGVQFVPAPDGRGLLGFVTATVNGLRLDGITVRRTRSDRLCLSFPMRRGSFRPLDTTTRREIEAQILAAIRAGKKAP